MTNNSLNESSCSTTDPALERSLETSVIRSRLEPKVGKDNEQRRDRVSRCELPVAFYPVEPCNAEEEQDVRQENA